MMLYLDDDDVSALFSIGDAIDCVDRCFLLLADGTAVNAVRRRSAANGTTLNVMWALAPTEGVLGVKEYPVVRSDVTQGAVLTLLLHAMDTGRLLAVLAADRLGQLRTGAASAVATRALARKDSETLALFGSGFQAESQALALAQVMPELRRVLVVGRDAAKRDRFAQRLRAALDIEVIGSPAQEAAERADVVVTATGSTEPVLLGQWLRPGTHVDAVGSNVASKREVDREVLARAARIVVDDYEVAANECGDLIANDWDQSQVVSLGDVLTGRAAGRSNADEITVFESQGLALQDVVCAGVIYERAVERGVGAVLSK
jgi:alanine dehydrogenase